MKYLILILLIFSISAQAQTITLTPEQVESVCQDVVEPEPIPAPEPEPTPTPEPEPTPAECENDSTARVVRWNSVFGQQFPFPAYRNVTNYQIDPQTTLAIQFNTGATVDDGKLSLLENPHSPGIRIGAISKCAGDFDVDKSCEYIWGLGGGIRWATNGKLGACELKRGATYYFNIDYSDCPVSVCRINLQHRNL